MPNQYPTLLDLAKHNGSDAVVGLIDETTRAIPEITVGAARPINGLMYKTRVRIELPEVGFRRVNEGTDSTMGKIENRLVQAYLMNPRWVCDKELAMASEDGPEMFIAEEGVAMTTAGFQKVAHQFYYGKLEDPNKGFPGLLAALDASMVVDATGTTEDTCSSVWAIKFGRQDVSWVWGLGASLDLSDVSEIQATDPNGKQFTAFLQELVGRPGVQVGTKWSVGRIKKLTEDNGKGLTDDLLADLVAKFPVGREPDALFMTRRSRKQLKKSRTATNATGAPAPTPTDYEGIPIYATEALLDTEKLAL